MLKFELQQLYATILVGNSPCHGFTKTPGNSGGFYHFVCRHGVSVLHLLNFIFQLFNVLAVRP